MTVQFCRTCGTKCLKKRAGEATAEKVRALTGQAIVWVFLCAQCNPEKVPRFLGKKEVKIVA